MKSTRILLALVLVGALAAGAIVTSGCSSKNVVAKVNGDAIDASALDSQIEQLKTSYPNMFTGADGEGRLIDMKTRLLENLINQKLIDQAAKDKGIKVSDADIQKQIDTLKSRFSDQAQFEAALKSSGMTVESLTAQLRQQAINTKLQDMLVSNAEVTPAEIKAYYDKNKVQFTQKAQKRASHILFKSTDKATATKVLKEIKAGTITFAAAAKKYSTDTVTKDKGGDLGWPSGTSYVPEFQAALDKLKKGEMSGLVQSTFGYHIILVTETRPAKQQSLAEVTTQITQIIQSQRKAEAYQKFLDDLRTKAKIEILVEELKGAATAGGSTTTTATQ